MSYLLADGDYYDAGVIAGGGDAYGSGGPPLDYVKFKAYYKRHKLGPMTAKSIMLAYNRRLRGNWVAVGKRAGKQKHNPTRNKKYAPKRKTATKKRKATTKPKKKVTKKKTKKQVFYQKYFNKHGHRRGALAAWRLKLKKKRAAAKSK